MDYASSNLGLNTAPPGCLWASGPDSCPHSCLLYPLRHRILAAYWALLETEAFAGKEPGLLHAHIPVTSWKRDASQQWLGMATNASLLKWKWYLQEWATPGHGGA